MDVTAGIRRWWTGGREARAYRALAPGERETLARDAGVPVRTLDRVAARGEVAGPALDGLLQAVGLDPQALARSRAAVLRDMLVVCSDCAATPRCRRSLDRGTARRDYPDNCPNAHAVNALVALPPGGSP